MITIRKRDGKLVPFALEKIFGAIGKAYNEFKPKDKFEEMDLTESKKRFNFVTDTAIEVKDELDAIDTHGNPLDVEVVQDVIVRILEKKNPAVAKLYRTFREKRTKEREKNSTLMQALKAVAKDNSAEEDEKRSNANVNGDTAMGTMLQIGSESSKALYIDEIIPDEFANAHLNGDIHIHDLDFYKLTETCCQIDLAKLFKGGFNTGHGTLREPQSIGTACALAAIAIQSNQNDQHGGQSIPAFDFYMAPYIKKSYEKNLDLVCELSGLNRNGIIADEKAWELTKKQTYQAMEGFVANLNSMHSRAGAQVPFSSINYGTDTSKEGRLVIEQLLLATEAGLGNGETPIFPIQIFKCKEGVNFNEGDANYDLFELACRVSAKRLFPNFSFLDAPFNKAYYKEGVVGSEVAYMGCRTRTIANIHDKTREIVTGRGNLSFTTINLPRLAIEAEGNIPMFFSKLTDMLDLVKRQLLERFRIQCKRHPKNYPFLMGQGVWIDSEKLGPNDDVTDILKHGSLSIGFIGLAETLVELTGKHHGESEESQKLGLEIVKFMREFCDNACQETKMNFALIGTPAEGLSGRFTKMDKKRYGVIPGVTDKLWYTNSSHVPVEYKCNAAKKIAIEAPYHNLENGGHIAYVEFDGDPSKNIEAFEKIVKTMGKMGVGYGAINWPLDKCPKCGHTGKIDDKCPECGSGEIERLRRITGYLVGTLDRFNDAKKAEVEHRVKHA